MKSRKIFLTITVLSIAILALAACDATGAVPLEELIGESGSTGSLVSEQSNSSSKLASASRMTESREGSPPEAPTEEMKLVGMVEEVTENSITINGTTFSVDTPVDLTTLFQVGTVYKFEYTLNADGSITVNNFYLDDGTSDEWYDDEDIEFEGLLEAVTEDTLTFNGETYTVDTDEDLTTLFTAGQMYEIEYMLNEDGTITLIEFSLEDMGSSSSSEGYPGDSEDDSYDDSYNHDDDYNNDNFNNNYDGNDSDNEYNDDYDNNDENSNNSENDYDNDNDNEDNNDNND